MLKKIKIYGAIFIILVIAFFIFNSYSKNEVGNVSLGLFTTKDIKIQKLSDPEVTGVTCHISNIVADLDFADPSESSISCRQTGEITMAMLANVDTSPGGEVVFKKSKSILFKTLKIKRIFDQSTQTLIYISYSTKEINGSYKHSMSTVPLWGTEAYTAPVLEVK
ncbi:CreA family protein [Psychromonas sp. Urea-02u-13]|uniref:CreA family protein n=1 Tax=Psychromonas sp. Urea-02u-13 TaxID=2058326 RepID=UPI000C331E26|nr:CreA family protein [Psychromonas sp. Urea-02u-13]PKG38597.1 catabolite regulation protein CreA [Psychromonas sp. Urea-02u-13]